MFSASVSNRSGSPDAGRAAAERVAGERAGVCEGVEHVAPAGADACGERNAAPAAWRAPSQRSPAATSCDDRAWHAGVSCYEGRETCNDFSLGIELEGTDDLPFTDAQYRSLIDLTLQLLAAYPGITPQRICGHSDIAPGRKTDPGPAFDWPRLRAALLAGPVASPIKE